MRTIAAVMAGSWLAMAATAATAAPAAEEGYPVGTLGLAAIERNDWAGAERQLEAAAGAFANDPARLINLGEVYYRTGRRDAAYRAWEAAEAAPAPFLVRTRDGRIVSTTALARQALSRRTLAAR